MKLSEKIWAWQVSNFLYKPIGYAVIYIAQPLFRIWWKLTMPVRFIKFCIKRSKANK